MMFTFSDEWLKRIADLLDKVKNRLIQLNNLQKCLVLLVLCLVIVPITLYYFYIPLRNQQQQISHIWLRSEQEEDEDLKVRKDGKKNVNLSKEKSKKSNCVEGTSPVNQTDILIKKGQMEYLSLIRNPCWFEYFSRKDINGLKNNMFLGDKPVRKLENGINELSSLLTQRLTEEKNNVRLRCLPMFNIVGQGKCGTTDLYNRLILHPQIASPLLKEPSWFAFGRKKPFAHYLELNDLAAMQLENKFKDKQCQQLQKPIIGEASVVTFSDNFLNKENIIYGQQFEKPNNAAQLMKWAVPQVKIIIILRNPIDRMYSEYVYKHKKKIKPSPSDFHEKADDALGLFKECLLQNVAFSCANNDTLIPKLQIRLHRSIYSVFLKEWLSVFSEPEQLLILRMEDYADNVNKTLHQIYDFLNIDAPSEEENKIILSNKIRNARKEDVGEMWNNTRQMLQEFYQPYNQQLAQLLNDERFLWSEQNQPKK